MKNKKILSETSRVIKDLAKAGKHLSIPRNWLGKNGQVAKTYADRASRIDGINKAVDQLLAGREAAKFKAMPETTKTVIETIPGKKVLGIPVSKPKTVVKTVKDTFNSDQADEFIKKGRDINTISKLPLGYSSYSVTTGRPLSTIRTTKTIGPRSGPKSYFDEFDDDVIRRDIPSEIAEIKERMKANRGKGPLEWLKKQEEKIAKRLAEQE